MDTFNGTSKDDQFIGDNSAFVNVTAADTLDGGKGTDTFKLYDIAVTTADLPTLKNIENVVLYDNAAVAAVDLTKWDSVETLFLVRDTSGGYDLGEKVTTVKVEDTAAAAQVLTFDDALTAATLDVNKVTGTVTVDGTALKTLTINASGKASNVTLTQAIADTIETLNITGKADLTLAYTAAGAPASKIVTIDGSKAEGKLDLDLDNTTAANLKTVKTGSADDKLALNTTVNSGTTIDLGAGNDKLEAGTTTPGSVVDSTTTVIDGGAGIDSLDAALVTVGNAGVFANFETLSLTTAIVAGTPLDLDLLTKSTITSIAKDFDAAHALLNVKKSQSLTINADASTVGSITTLTFKASEIAGTADAYTINFAKDADALVAGATATVDANTVTIDGIETVNINSTGATATTGNLIKLDADAAKSLVITGDKALDVTFVTFGDTTANATNGLGVSTIDASAATGAVNIDLVTGVTAVTVAVNGLTIKGGSAADTITLSADGGTITGGAGEDTFDVTAAQVVALELTVADGAIKTTITDIEKGDIISGIASVALTKGIITGATNLDDAITAAFTTPGATDNIWFQYGIDTYIVADMDSDGAISANDVIVKLNGLKDLSTSTVSATGDLTIA